VEYGSEVVTRCYVTTNNGRHRGATASDEWLDYYGRIDKVVSARDDGDGRPTNAELNEMERTARRNIRQRAPQRVRVPEGATLNPNALLTFDELVPGTWVPVRAAKTCLPLTEWHKIDRVVVEVSSGVESVSLSIGTAPVNWVDPL